MGDECESPDGRYVYRNRYSMVHFSTYSLKGNSIFKGKKNFDIFLYKIGFY